MSVSRKDVDYIAELARLKFTEEEKSGFITDLNNILGYVDKLSELDTEGADILVNPIYIENVYREDVVTKSMEQEEFLMNAPDRVEEYLRVPSVIEV
ncbi:Asp-tRNA(Asn)/Glu-tRNA(Gln) amidotransferase subunit GatC [Youngiibacter multivorans]|jgi:aspartyl-tRNA(Asn)/glutamyl-tRNA(Gln) amidotransferase subunit C|uniref:Aspartyl/glutamyl-tRNA(Asn/Gln) amidotransferase subunit C n=1 Tax=Youngiibacter multivorans TaxID=937251 RepID=A0ABS4G6M3_9CLOT|nr:Asp-tRNA(Asn)/Glu-tRNA(Gln) amidotransferase subunit GatC [Youngiibacter multivorans]MBP1920181.1 aspartyl-tRNA(Asn)/glutamyl-tRNA(Gln) amidotransferase subunit C [Youngiibacter multivorans]